MPSDPGPVTIVLERIRQGSESGLSRLFDLLYAEVYRRARCLRLRESPGLSLGATDLVNEAFLHLTRNDEFAKSQNTAHVLQAFSLRMKNLLLDHKRNRQCLKRGGDRNREELDDLADYASSLSQLDVLELHESLRALAEVHPRATAVLEMRFFGAFTMAEIVAILGGDYGPADLSFVNEVEAANGPISLRTLEREYRHGLAWLHAYLGERLES